MTLVSCASLLYGMENVSAKGALYSVLSSVVDTRSTTLNTNLNEQDTVKKKHIVSTERNSARSIFTSWFFQPFRSSFQQNQTAGNSKLLSNVKVFPNPTVESINLSFRLSKRAEVAIKVMDALGNEMMVLLSQTLDSGNQSHSFDIQGKLATGVYFVRLSSGTETVVKRISVL